MSIDGSFNLQSSLQRFLARCPNLQSNPRLKSLSQKGENLTEDEAVSATAELFLNEKYTIPIIGCFRPIARSIVDKAVELLSLARDLKSSCDDSAMELDDDDNAYFIEAYIRRGNGLKLHETACLAFSRALDLAPFVLRSVVGYFNFSPPPFQRLLGAHSASQVIEKDGTHLLVAMRASFRLLQVEPQVFSELWDWSSFLDLVQKSTHVVSDNNPGLNEMCLDIKWCAIQIISVTLKMSDRVTMNFGMDVEKSLACLLRWEEFCQDVSLEKAGLYLDMDVLEMGKLVDRDSEFNHELCLKSIDFGPLNTLSLHSKEINSLNKIRKQITRNAKSLKRPFARTPAVKNSFQMVLMAVSQKWPVLLYGPTGAGKTALINELAQVSGNRVLSIHLDEQMDGKTLIGSYVCTEQPGEFRWQPGSLTQAIMNGFWVVFEDIDKAPSDVHSILLPLLEGASSFVTDRGEAIRVTESFRLFATVSNPTNDPSHMSEGKSMLGVLWRRVMISPATDEELSAIVSAWYGDLSAVAKNLIETYEMIRYSRSHHRVASRSYDRISLRDLLKWCKRIDSLGFSFQGLSLSAHERKMIYQEAVDIFAASSASYENRLVVMKVIAKMWGVPEIEAETSIFFSKPVVQEMQSGFQIGRVILRTTNNMLQKPTRYFVDIRSSLQVLERIACSVKHNEPVLLVGETGTGKTTLVQNLASRLDQPLTVLNLSQQSDVGDLLGGVKPTDPQFICVPLYNEFMELFTKTFSKTVNPAILGYLRRHKNDKNWKKVLEVLEKGHQKVLDLTRTEVGVPGSGKRKRPLSEEILRAWGQFSDKLKVAHRQIDASSCMAFSFVEGAFVTSLKKGHWILLDEINLAPPETLQRIMGVLEGESGSLCLTERGDVDYIERHSDFRLFACMNPATDAGKRDLPFTVRSRFTEYFVDEILNDEDLTLFIKEFLDEGQRNRELVSKIVHFYKAAKKESEDRLQDGANQKPQFSLRSLYRALEYVKKAERKFGFQKALYDGFCMFFLTLLDGPSAKFMNSTICSYLLGGSMPQNVPFDSYLIVAESSKSDPFLDDYILTFSVKEHLRNLARAIFIKRYPVLLQGPTSSGKTSLVRYLATVTGHEFVRINNHEHTDLQEYLGSYVTDASGKLVFQEGVLVKAVRSGCWIVLDELNLAPSDVLEALNRLLDDNRELFVPELQETIKAHPDFMLFATQNPPTVYGGRKILSRAFRNRFVEIHVDEIPEDELSTILEKRCKIPETYAKKMVDVMKDLQMHRQSSKIFAGKHGFITPRDLFRWANRFQAFGSSYEDLAKDGYFLLAERLRDENEKKVVQEILEKRLRVKLVEADLYKQITTYTRSLRSKQQQVNGSATLGSCYGSGVQDDHGNVIWTKSMQRLYFLVERCYKLREPVLLVGETGGGKTTICQLLSAVLKANLHILNCHQFTETSDFLGGFYPVRDRSVLSTEFKNVVEQLMLSNVVLQFPGATLSTDIGEASSTFSQLSDITNTYRKRIASQTDVPEGDLKRFEQMKMSLIQLYQKWQTIFTWHDGPLVQAMKNGDLFLVDEISLADDSVLERLNSVLEPERKLSLAEKGGPVLENISAHPNFFLLATMNPGGDYGKKELSPALRNRLTEIWVPPMTDSNELRSIALSFINTSLSYSVEPLLKFWEWFRQFHTSRMLTVRDLLSWIDFMNVTEKSFESPNYGFLHGAFLVLLDGLSLGTGMSRHEAEQLREQCLSFLLECLKPGVSSSEELHLPTIESFGWGENGRGRYNATANIVQSDKSFGITPFCIHKGEDDCKPEGFEFLAPTTCRNAMRVLRAMQLMKPVLLEGSPGVGKTSLIVALGKFSGHRVVRINLSEQTDIMDLLGSDLPVEDATGMKFAWSDGILLQALKNGDWVLLDELNLAPQSVLEGLNAILDHRAEVFIPELGRTYKCPPSFRIFACQNPSCQGGGRKGLPKSFLNRFTKVYVDELGEDDYLYICNSLHPSIPKPLLSKLILFNKRLYVDTMISRKFGQDGSPWEFNLRDVLRSCQIIEGTPEISKADCFLSVVYIQRLRTAADRQEAVKLYEEVFGVKPSINLYPRLQLNPRYLIVGNTSIERNLVQPFGISKSQLKILPGTRHSLEAVMHCVQHQWLCILVGPSASGKTSLVRLLAQLTGNALNELNLSSATDISELLGCFEQYNAFRNIQSAISQIGRYINEYCSRILESSLEVLILESKGLVSRWFAFVSTIYGKPLSSSASAYAENWESGSESSLSSLIKIIEQLKTGLERYRLPVSWSTEDLNKVLKIVIELLENSKKQAFPAKFEWVTGLLIRAIECGEWIVLENANLCNPTVLDRINSLVEPSGSITVNECGLVDGKPVVLQANRKFRLFLTVNPRYGEVSRAMRNRGIEVFMMQPDWVHDGEKGYNRNEMEMHDLKRFLVLSGIPSSTLVEIMAEAHIFARDVGADFGVRITLLELSRWVQLLQQLLLNGNMSLWSLQVSWEHTYLSSLGESGRSSVDLAKNLLLSASNLCKSDAYLKTSLSLPGGWPTPLQLRDFVWHSRQACVKQNCMYLEFLGHQFASYELSSSHYRGLAMKDYAMNGAKNKISTMEANRTSCPSVMPLEMILQVLFPTTSYQRNPGCPNLLKFDQDLVHKMLWFAANWTIEQVTEGDFKLYLLCLQWYSSQLHPYCRFFESYLKILKQEVEHSIWNCIFDCRRELTSHYGIDVDMEALPVLSLKLLNLTRSNGNLQGFKIRLHRSIKCVDLLHRSFQQWNAEDDCSRKEENQFSPVLESLRVLEKEVFSKLVHSQCFDRLFQIFSSLIEHHSVLWDGIISSSHESLILAWRSLEKDLKKLKCFFPEFVKDVLVQSHESVNLSPWIFQYVKSMLWVYGGHPFLPSSWDTYSMMQQLLKFCQSVWPTNTIPWKQGSSAGTHIPVKAIVSANVELRSLAMQGVCMSSFLTRKGDEDDSSIVQQLEEMHQILLRRFEHEIEKSEAMLVSSDHSSLKRNLSACCVFFPEEFHTKLSYSSWQDMFCLFDSTSFFLDMDLLKVLSNAVLEDEKLHMVLSNTSDLLETSLSFSLRFSSRPPMDFIPHQAILWALDAWESVNAVNTKIASSVLDMWFKWHSVLWTRCPQRFEVDISDSSLPYMLFQPAKTATINRILKDAFPVKEFEEHCLKLRVVSANLWNDSPPKRDLPNILLSTACCLFQQIVFAHKKSFKKEIYAEIKSSFGTIRGTKDKLEKLQSLRSLIATSNHNRLTSLMQSFISPLLDELYLHNSSHDFLENLGRAWLHVGGLRFHLLLNPDDLDPAIRYSVKHSQIVEKISLLQLEIKVRQECESLVGSSSSNDVLRQKQNLLEKMEEDRRGLQRKVVFRHDASKFTRLKTECAKFIEDASKFTRLKPACATFTASYAEPTKNMSTPQLINESLNWQETATSFIYRLSEEYAAYADIIQPIQVAVYEMKLGLALVVSSALQKTFLAKTEVTIDHNLEAIYSFMRFPRTMAANLNSNEACNKGSDHLDNDVSADILAMDIRFLKNLCTILGDSVSDTTVSVPQLNATLYHNVLVRGTHCVVNSLLIGFNTFKFLSDIFERFASLWMSMKVQTKAKEDDDARNYKFKTRAFNIEDILEIDVTTFRDSLSDDSLSMEWQEMMVEDESSVWVAPKEHENLEEEWGLIQESLLNSMVHIHNQFFGSQNLIDHPGFNKISDADRLLSFLESYKLGSSMVKVLPALQSPTLDAQLVPEHLLYVCLEYEEKFGQFRNPARIYNIYKDPNASLMAKTVDPLIALQQRVLFLLNEWPDHPGLQKILDVTEMLLAVPLTTPLAKVLSGLQFLLTKAHQLQENAPKLSISDQMQPILILVSTWQKMELDSWTALLDGVQEQYEINSGKLWFPLYSVLYRGQTVDNSDDIQFTIQSLKEFIQTSSLGEFKRRLQLLLAFHGQIGTGICLKYYSCLIEKESSPSPMENMENMQKILYNVFGYYMQFLAVVSEHIETNKKKISADLRELVKLYRWERPDNYLSMETTKRTRQKLKKHIQKFNDVLQQPVMVILNQEAAKRGIKVQSMLEQKVSTDIPESKCVVSPNSTDINVLSEIERSIWYADWRKKVDFALEYWCPTSLSGLKLQYLRLKDVEEAEGFMRQSHPGCLIYWEEWKELELSLQFICGRIAGSADIWETEKKNNRKRRALSDMLKLLEDRGLSKHRPMISEDVLKSNPSSSWFLQPSYNVQHLLLLPSGEPTVDDVTSSSQFQTPLNKDMESNWKIANDYYYKSIAMVHFLRQICLNCHKDFNVDQVSRSASFLEHLIEIQQEQRFFAYKFSEDLRSLRNCVYSLTDLLTNHPSNDSEANGESCVSLKQKTTRECMWNQKHLFDNLYRISHETSLLLRNVEDTHLNTCQSIKVASNKFLACIEKFVPDIRKSKESLDQYLLGGRRILTTSEAISRPFIVSKQMEQLVKQNIQQIDELEQHIQAFFKQDVDKRSVEMSLTENFLEVLRKGKVAMQIVYSDDASSDTSSDPEVEFGESFNKNLELIREVYQKLGSSTNTEVSLSTNITHWKVLVETFLANMQLDRICKQLGETIARAVQLIDHVGNRNPNECSQIQKCLNLLIVLVDLIMTLGDGFLLEFLSMHKTIAEMTHMLADVFASLYSKGFGGPSEDQTDDNEGDKSQPASGTGMGEGDGVKDVSEQIEDEDQLLGASDKPDEGQDPQNEAHGKDEKGIEMNEDFDAATFSVSEDSEDDENKEDGEDEEPESAMGNTGDDNEVVDEKLWDKEDEGNPETKNEKYESGPSVNDMDSSSRELRAKEDDDATQDDPGKHDTDKSEKDGTKNDGDEDENENENENVEDMKLDKDEASADPTGIEMDDQTHQNPEEDTNMEGPIEEDEATDPMEEVEPDDGNENENENGNHTEDEMTDQPDEEDPGKAESGQLDGNTEGEDPKKDQNEASETDLLTTTNNSFEQGESNLSGSNVPCSNSGMQMTSESSSSAIPPKEQLSSNGLAPSIGLPLPETDLTLPDSTSGGNLTADEPSKPQSEQDKNSSTQRAQPNPYRSVGDALEKWKERVEVSIDANPNEDTQVMDDDNADEYGFVPESEKGTNQALGPATQDQVDKNVKGSNIEGDDEEDEGVRQTKIETQKEQELEPLTTKTHSAIMNKLDEKMKNSNLNEEEEVKEDEIVRDPGSASTSGNLVTLKSSYMDEDEGDEERLEHSNDLSSEIKKLEINNGDNDEAITLWRKYEQITTRLSHELAEQLRLVMEPTLANKLQGDYKTGKRLNMKKVISYIASHYRKDKIWLRRTRPNKRDYQVMVAIDDSRSMSESGCGDVAIEALVTVCRAMSQLEIGQLAVTSFGKKGNIRVLQDFDQQFTSEAGMKMVSSLKFDQENTIRDEPVVDLLQYLNKMMDEASVNSKQLVLIIADGRFHEKERLKRCVRDLLSKDRMVAFLLLDSPDESIMEFMEASFEGESVKFTKYLNSFPFPYYIVLKNIEALPRTLADLLRQWFELMQNTRD